MFILIGYLVYYVGLIKVLFEVVKWWFVWVSGGLVVLIVFVIVGFVVVLGVFVVILVVFVWIVILEMLKIGYDKCFVVGVVVVGGIFVFLIFFFVILVIYVIIVE